MARQIFADSPDTVPFEVVRVEVSFNELATRK